MTAPRPLPAGRHRVHPAVVDNRRHAGADAHARRIGRAAATLGELLGVALEDAACRGRAPQFDSRIERESDEQRAARIDAAKAACRQCPALVACAASAADTPAHLRSGVLAGHDYGEPAGWPAAADSAPAAPLPDERRPA